MTQRGEKPKANTLAGMWLKSRGDAGDEQMGLLFSVPMADAPARSAPAETLHAKAVAPLNASAERRVWTVRTLIMDIRQQVETGFADVWVEGEISNCRPAGSGHIYFTLKDREAQLPVVLFRRQAQLLRFRPVDGMAVLARGRVSVYESRGQLQLIAETLEPRGAGALQVAYEQLKARLLAEGLFEQERKKPLPTFPRTVGVITSTGGAVLHDIIQVIRRRHACLNLLIYPAPMQGPECAGSVVRGLRWFERNRDRVDLILIARGGGSIEDLAGFNNEGLARAIAACTLPVVSAVGHETDFSIADFVADLRAPTPSAAAELITAAQHRIEERVSALDGRVRRAIRYQMMLARQRFTALSAGQMQGRVQSLIGRRSQRLDDLCHRLESAAVRGLREPSTRMANLKVRLDRQNPAGRLVLARRRLEVAEGSLERLAGAMITARTTRLEHAAGRLEALSPLAVLSRGYALVYAEDGRLVRDAAELAGGQRIRARLAKGSVLAEVERVNPE